MVFKTMNIPFIDNKGKDTKPYSFFAIGDPHFRENVLQELDLYSDNLISLIQEKRPDIIIFLGDILHDHGIIKHVGSLNKFYRLLVQLIQLAPVYILVGNHDMVNEKAFLSTDHWMNVLKKWTNVSIVDEGMILNTPQGEFTLTPYVEKNRLKEALNIINPNWKESRIVFAHQEMRGCLFGNTTSEHGDLWEDTDPLLISGHIHEKQRLKYNIYYPGSSRYTDFGEKKSKTILFCTATKEQIEFEECSLHLPINETITINATDFDTFKYEQDEMVKQRIFVSGTQAEIEKIRSSPRYKEIKGNSKNQIRLNIITPQIKYTREVESIDKVITDMIQTRERKKELLSLYEALK